ncbi:MAG: SIS domain-containing protein [Candidatus Woesearchaeota archaeon]
MLSKQKQLYQSYIIGLKEQIKESLTITGDFKILEDINHIVIVGKGVNSIASDMLKTYLNLPNLTTASGFELPNFPKNSKNVLFFILSYSGEDDEALFHYRAALKNGCKIIGVTGGGQLKQAFERNMKERILIPQKVPEWAALPYLFFPVLKVLENSGIVPSQKTNVDDLLLDLSGQYQTTAQQFSVNLKSKVILVYASSYMLPAAKRWKSQLNNISRVPSFFGNISDVVNDELNGFSTILPNVHVVLLRCIYDNENVQRQIDAAKTVLRSLKVSTTEIVVKKHNALTTLFSAVHLGDWIAFNLGQELLDSETMGEDAVEMFRKFYKKQ